MEAAYYDKEEGLVIDSKPKEMYCALPMIWFESIENSKLKSEIPDDESEESDNEQKKIRTFRLMFN